jgi:hypothetical protein
MTGHDIAKLRQQTVAHALACLGMGEHPAGSNRGPLPDECFRFVHGQNSDPGAVSEDERQWCAEFACLMTQKGGVQNGPKSASTGGLHHWGELHQHLGALPETPSPGDIGCILADDAHPTATGFKHTVLILHGTPDALLCVAGNEGDRVAYSTRPLSSMKIVNPYVLG